MVVYEQRVETYENKKILGDNTVFEMSVYIFFWKRHKNILVFITKTYVRNLETLLILNAK